MHPGAEGPGARASGGPAAQRDRPGNRPHHAAGLHVVAERPGEVPLVRPAPSRARLQRANLLMIRPYEPGKIPVVMVHGLISTPLAWIPMLNELLRDPAIQEKYQFMLYMYPTGVPMPIAAANLRDVLSQAKMTFNPDGRDPAFDRTVLLGHSMGGLLSHF